MSMDDVIRIPDEIWEERCRWCVHRQTEKNRSVVRWETSTSRQDVSASVPCRILSIAGYDRIPGECVSFAPHDIYGLCMTCAHDRMFHRKEGFCELDERPNYRQVYLGIGYQNPEYWGRHRLSTCDNYCPNSIHFDGMRRDAAEGKIPQNFDPETMEPVRETERNETAEKWARIREKQEIEDTRKRAEAEMMREQLEAERSGQIPGQVSMEELI